MLEYQRGRIWRHGYGNNRSVRGPRHERRPLRQDPGAAPRLDIPLQIAPVDYVARAIVTLSLQEDSLGRTFHLVNPEPVPWTDLFEMVRTMGYRLSLLSYEVWATTLIDATKSNTDNALFGLVPLFSQSTVNNLSLPTFDCADTVTALADTGIACPPIDARLLTTYFSRFVECGFLGAPPGPPALALSSASSEATASSGPSIPTAARGD